MLLILYRLATSSSKTDRPTQAENYTGNPRWLEVPHFKGRVGGLRTPIFIDCDASDTGVGSMIYSCITGITINKDREPTPVS